MDPHYAQSYARLERDHWWWRARRGFVLGLLDRYDDARRTGGRPRLLEVGTGAGANLIAAASWYDCEGIEPDPLLREEAARLSGCPIGEGSLPGPLPFEVGVFDTCLLLDVIEHVEDDAGAMSEIRRVTRPGGLAIINVPAMPALWSIHDEVNQHFRRYTSSGLLSMLDDSGWDVLSWRYWATALVPLVWAERRLLRRSESREDYAVTVPSPVAQTVLGGVTRLDYALNPLRHLAGTSLLVACRPRS